MSRQTRLEQYAKPFDAVSGFSSKDADLKYWADRASKNSYHSPAPGHEKNDGPGSKNNVRSRDDYMPGVRRSAEGL